MINQATEAKTIEDAAKAEANLIPAVRSGKLWVAYILDIRAIGGRQVYVMVCWMYLPDGLPKGTVAGKKIAGGHQLCHGENELIASNHSMYIKARQIV